MNQCGCEGLIRPFVADAVKMFLAAYVDLPLANRWRSETVLAKFIYGNNVQLVTRSNNCHRTFVG